MPEPEVIHDDTLARLLYEAITETRSPAATVAWEHLNDSEHRFYLEAAARMSSAGALSLIALPDDATDDEEPQDEGVSVINMRHALQVDAISVGILRADDGTPALVGHFGGQPRDEPDRNVGVAWSMGIPAVLGLLHQVIDCTAAADLELAGQMVAVTVQAMEEAIKLRSPGLVLPAIRPTDAGRN
jgi:hypothetical protein